MTRHDLAKEWLLGMVTNPISKYALEWALSQEGKQDAEPDQDKCNCSIEGGGWCTLPKEHSFPLHIARAAAGNCVNVGLKAR